MTNAQSPTPEQIEQRAYALYLERGGQDGHALEDWLAAEREMTERSQAAETTEATEPSSSAAVKSRAASASQQASPASSIGRPQVPAK